MLSHFSCVWLFVTLSTIACQASMSMKFSRQEYWSELPWPPPGDLPNPGTEPVSPVAPALQVDSLLLSHQGRPYMTFSSVQSLSRVRLFVTPWTAAHQASLSVTSSWSLTQTHVHWVSDDIQPSNPLSSPSLPAFNLSQHQGLFQWVSSSHEVAKVSEFQLQHQSLQWIFSTDFL